MVGQAPPRYDGWTKAAMIELTDQQAEALQHADATPPRVVNPRTKETFVLLPVDEYRRLKDEDYDDGPWTREELQAQAWDVAERTGWEEIAPGRCGG
jgi:PHD/YefM family antitoxin component YafN of YafNO toxin-antitoxin module